MWSYVYTFCSFIVFILGFNPRWRKLIPTQIPGVFRTLMSPNWPSPPLPSATEKPRIGNLLSAGADLVVTWGMHQLKKWSYALYRLVSWQNIWVWWLVITIELGRELWIHPLFTLNKQGFGHCSLDRHLHIFLISYIQFQQGTSRLPKKNMACTEFRFYGTLGVYNFGLGWIISSL